MTNAPVGEAPLRLAGVRPRIQPIAGWKVAGAVPSGELNVSLLRHDKLDSMIDAIAVDSVW
jgi:hypothetical protein